MKRQKYSEALKSIPAPGGGGCHAALLGVANLGIFAGLSEAELFADIRAHIPSGGRSVPDSEIRDAITKAKADQSTFNPIRKTPRKRLKRGEAFDAIIADTIEDASEVELFELSPYRFEFSPFKDSVILLNELYKNDDILFIGDTYSKQVKKAKDWKRADVSRFPLIIPNPLTGKQGKTKSGKISVRCDSCVASFHFAVVEFDNVSIKKQIAFWLAMLNKGFPVACLIHSGNKSIHGWVKVDCANVEEWENEVENKLFPDYLQPLGVDPACRNESRLSRLPGHERKKGVYQRLLYLNPEFGRRSK